MWFHLLIHGYFIEQVVKHLLGRNGVLEQRDGGYCTALDIAKARGHEDLVSLLEGAGAVHSSGKGDHRQLHLMGDKYIAPSSFRSQRGGRGGSRAERMSGNSQRKRGSRRNEQESSRERTRADQDSWRTTDD